MNVIVGRPRDPDFVESVSEGETKERGRSRRIGPGGTAARAAVGAALVGSVAWGHARSGLDLLPWLIGLALLPGLTMGWQRWRSRRHPARLVVGTGPIGHVMTFVGFLALYFTWWYAPGVSVLSDAAMIFYGTTMLVAAARGYAGCEVLAVSNWMLGRDDQVGCLLFEPIDRAEHTARREGDRDERF